MILSFTALILLYTLVLHFLRKESSVRSHSWDPSSYRELPLQYIVKRLSRLTLFLDCYLRLLKSSLEYESLVWYKKYRVETKMSANMGNIDRAAQEAHDLRLRAEVFADVRGLGWHSAPALIEAAPIPVPTECWRSEERRVGK